MSQSQFILLSVILFSLFECSAPKEKSQQQTPNVLIIAVDDMKDWVGYLNGYEGKVYTPNIDKLANQGVAFMNAHTASSVCCPSRNAFMLGKRPSTTGLYDNGQWCKASLPEEIAMPEYFKKNGYYTAGAGKIFHHTPGNNAPCNWDFYQEQVFDDPWNFADWDPERFFLLYGYRGPIQPYPEWKPLNGIFPIRSELDWGPIPGKSPQDYGDLEVVRFAEDFLSRKHEKPFFLALGTYRPHLPWHVPQEYFDKYPLQEIVLPPYLETDLDDIPPIGHDWATKTSDEFFQIREENKLKKAIQAYLASISFADDQVGNILTALENSEFAENTIVVFWSDHGWHLGSKDHFYKSTLWEEATRIPFVVYAPGMKGNGKVCNRPVDMVNVFPTLINLTGLPAKNDLDGYDITQLLTNPDTTWQYPAITQLGRGNVAVRSQDMRYIRYSDDTEELYDHKIDSLEWNNLAGRVEYDSIKKDLKRWVPSTFAKSVPSKGAFFFDPHEYTYLNRKTKEFIDGKK